MTAADPTGDVREQIAEVIYSRDCFAGDDPWSRVHPVERERCRRGADAVLALPAVRDALAAQETVRRVEGLFAGGPDTPCRTTWREDPSCPECSAASTECVEVPLDELRRALAGES